MFFYLSICLFKSLKYLHYNYDLGKAEIDILEADDDLGLLRSNVSWGRGQLVLLAFPQVTTEQGKKDLVKFKRDPAVRRYKIQTIYGPLCIVIVMFVAFHLWAHKLI